MSRRTRRPSIGTFVLATSLLAACGPMDSTADFPWPPTTHVSQTLIVRAGTSVWLGNSPIRLAGTTPVVLESVDAIGLLPGTVTSTLAMSTSGIGGIGPFPADSVPLEFRAAAPPLAGYVVTPGTDPVQLIVVVTAPPGGLNITGLRVHYTRDGMRRTVFDPDSFHVCIAPDPPHAPACPTIDVHE